MSELDRLRAQVAAVEALLAEAEAHADEATQWNDGHRPRAVVHADLVRAALR